MTAQDVTRVMGDVPRETIFAAEGANMRRREFPGAIPSKVTLTDGRVSRVTLDAFRVDKGDLPAYSHKAWPGMAASAVRPMLASRMSMLRRSTPLSCINLITTTKKMPETAMPNRSAVQSAAASD